VFGWAGIWEMSAQGGVMAFWKRFFGDDSKPVSSPPPPRDTSSTEPSGFNLQGRTEAVPRKLRPLDVEIRDFDFSEKPDSRVFSQVDSLSMIPKLYYGFDGENKDIARASDIIKRILTDFADYEPVHYWNGLIQIEKGDIPAARTAYANGTRLANQKRMICGAHGNLELEHGELRDAVKWWIRSALIQLQSQKINETQSFMFLGFIASLCQHNEASAKLMNAAANGPPVSLSAKIKNLVSSKLHKNEHFHEIEAQIQLLADNYL
jgi:hypothetical protein